MGSWTRKGDSAWDTDRRAQPRATFPRVLRVLRVRADAEGRLQPAPRGFGPLDHSEEWWQAVLRDQRARIVDPKRHLDRLASCAGHTITIACAPCRVRRSFEGDDLIARFGGLHAAVRPLRSRAVPEAARLPALRHPLRQLRARAVARCHAG